MKRSYGRRKKTVPRRRARVSRRRMPFAKKVKRVINRAAETKWSSKNSLETVMNTDSTGFSFVPTNVFQITVGTAADQRIGNQITPMSVTWRMIFKNNSLSNVYIRLIVLEVMDTDSTLFGDLFLRGGASQPQYGDLRDMQTPLNRRTYSVKRDSTFTIGFAGSDWPTAMRRVTVPYRRTLQYENNISTTEPRRRLVMLLLARRADADEPVGGDTVEVTTDVEMKYKDL